MDILVRKGQKVEISNDDYNLEGMALRDWDAEGEAPLYIMDDSCVLKVRVDLATSFIVDGVDIIDQL